MITTSLPFLATTSCPCKTRGPGISRQLVASLRHPAPLYEYETGQSYSHMRAVHDHNEVVGHGPPSLGVGTHPASSVMRGE